MARRNDLELSPAQEAGIPRHETARVYSPSKTTGNDSTGLGEHNGVEVQKKVAKNVGSAYGELQSDDAADMADLINVACLSGANIRDANPTHKLRERQSLLKNTISIPVASSREPPGPLDANVNFINQPLASPDIEVQSQIPQEAFYSSDLLSDAEFPMVKSLARPKATYGDISKTQKPKRSGRPDLYEVPQSPPRTFVTQTKLAAPKRRGPKPKRAPTLPRYDQAIIMVEGESAILDDHLEESRTHIQHTGKFPDLIARSSLGTEGRIAGPKRHTRSTAIIELIDHERSNRKYEKQQRIEVNERQNSHGVLQLSSPIQPGLGRNNDKPGGQDLTSQARFAAVEPVESQYNLRGHSKMKSPAKSYQSAEKSHVTPSKRSQEVETASTEENVQPGLHGAGPILSAPTPVKGIQTSPRRLQRPSNRPPQIVKLTRNGAQTGSSLHVRENVMVTSTGQENSTNEDDDAPQACEVSTSLSPLEMASQPRRDGAPVLLDGAIISKMMETIKKAGCNSKGDNMTKGRNMNSVLGRNLTELLAALTTKYQIMNRLISAKFVDVGKVDKLHQKVLKIIGMIREKSHTVLTERLGSRRSGAKNAVPNLRKNMLEDLYLDIIPGLVAALNGATKSRPDREVFKSSDLEEFCALFKVLHKLVKAAVDEDKSVQPKAPPGRPYSISQPTRILLPISWKAYKACEDQLIARKAEQLQQTAPERSRKRKERLEAEERLAEEQFQERLRQRNKAIIASLDERRAELGLPPCSQHAVAISTSRHAQVPKYNAETFDVNHDMNQRLTGVFGRNNSHPGTTPEEWTKPEMEILVNGLRDERGPTRYEKLATKLDRTLDEIFDRAKYLKMQIEYTLKRLQEEQPDKEFPPVKPWIENIGSEGFLNE